MTFMNNNIPDARTRLRRLGKNVPDQYTFGGNSPNPAMQRVMEMNPFMQYGSAPMDRSLGVQGPNNAVTIAQQAVAGRAFGDNRSRQMAVDPNINNRFF